MTQITHITSGVFECQLPEFVTLGRVWLSQGDIRIHTSWVCGSGVGTAEGFGFTGGVGGFGFMILREHMFTFQKRGEKIESPFTNATFVL